jgi:hypothetical protein
MSEIACQESAYPGRHQEQSPAVTVVAYPTGLRKSACEDCARHWICYGPGTARLLPLSEYVDPWEAAKAQAQQEQNLRNLQDAFTRCPEDLLRRIANGYPLPEDWKRVDLMMGESPAAVSQRMTDGIYLSMADQLAACAGAKRPAPLQDLAWQALRERGLPLREAVPAAPPQAYGIMGFARPDKAPRRRPGRPTARRSPSQPGARWSWRWASP